MTPFTKDDCFRTFLSSCSRKFKLIQARALASSNLSRLVLSQAQTYPGSCSRKLKLIQARALASSYLSRPVLFSEKKKALLSLNFLFRNIFVQLEKLSALPIYFLIFDESVKFSNFFLLECKKSSFSSSINFSQFAIFFGAKFSGKRHGLQKNRRTRVIYYLLVLLLLSALIRFPLTSSLRSLWRDLLIRFLHCLGAWLLFVGWRHCRVIKVPRSIPLATTLLKIF